MFWYRVERQLERRDHTEVAATTAQRPQQIGVALPVAGDEAAVGEHDVRRQQVVAAEPTAPRQVAEPATQRQPGDAGGGDDPTGGGEPERARPG